MSKRKVSFEDKIYAAKPATAKNRLTRGGKE